MERESHEFWMILDDFGGSLSLSLSLSLSIALAMIDPKQMDGLLDRRRSPIKITYYGWIHITDNLRLADMFGRNPRTFADFIQILVCTIVMFAQSQNHIIYSTYDLWLCSHFCWLNFDWLPVRSKFLRVKSSIFGWWNPHVASNWRSPWHPCGVWTALGSPMEFGVARPVLGPGIAGVGKLFWLWICKMIFLTIVIFCEFHHLQGEICPKAGLFNIYVYIYIYIII